MKKYDIGLRLKINAPNNWDKEKVRIFIKSIFDLVKSPLGSIEAEVIDVRPTYIDISLVGGKK